MYCPECGIDHHAAPVTEPEAAVVETAEVTEAAVRIAEIEAKRDVTLARIAAGAVEVEAEIAVAEATARADAAEDALEAVTEPEPAEPVVVVADAPAEPQPEPDAPEIEPPPAVKESTGKTGGYGSSAWFGGR